MAHVYVAGSLNIDQHTRVAVLPTAGETVSGSDVVLTGGGKGGNQAVAAARAGASVIMLGALGEDSNGVRVLQALNESRVDTAHVRMTAQPTGLAIITVDAQGENFIVVTPGANDRLREADIDAGLAAMTGGDLLLLQLEIRESVVRYAAGAAQRRGGRVVLNAAPAPTDVQGLFDDVDILIVNEHEARSIAALAGVSSNDDADLVRELAERFELTVICTAGADGAYASVGDQIAHVHGLPVIAVDTTAAGDAFVGYLAAGLTEHPDDLPAALLRATKASALTVTRPGAMDAIPALRDVELISEPHYTLVGELDHENRAR